VAFQEDTGSDTDSTAPELTPEQIQAIADAIAGKTKEEPEFEFGADNEEVYGEYADPTNWVDTLEELLLTDLINAGNLMGEDPSIMANFFGYHFDAMLVDMDNFLFKDAKQSLQEAGIDMDPAQYYLSTSEGINNLFAYAQNYYKQQWSAISPFLGQPLSKSGGGGGGGGGGPRVATEQEIRNKFDLDELANGVDNLWRGILLTENENPRAMAKSYVDAIVATQGLEKIDFESFVRNKIEESPRFASIYRNKPKAMSAEAYIQPYFQAAQQIIGPNRAPKVAIGAAQFGADNNSFRNRLRRDDAVTGSSSFINEMESRLTDLNGLFKG
jgi:hypothetical protein